MYNLIIKNYDIISQELNHTIASLYFFFLSLPFCRFGFITAIV